MVSREKFWSLLLKGPLREHVAVLSAGECTRPLDLQELAAQVGVQAKLMAPKLISLDALEVLPPSLRQRELYVIRLGQRHRGRAMFVLCRACRGYAREALRPEEQGETEEFHIELGHLPKWILLLAQQLRGEAVALLGAAAFVRAMSGGQEVHVLPSVRLASTRFAFRPTEAADPYTYWGQVEIDAVLGAKRLYALEAKSGKQHLLKYKVAFSALALAGVLSKPVHPLVAFVSREKGRIRLIVMLLTPPAKPAAEPYVVERLRPAVKASVLLPNVL
ncbi:hypothetical protein DRO60_02730 [Candidatus Bathyarchaeota archaeon]|nr:MAG: hypothetical protein DRO60_02730 [Candidatus Bathyarchaeota archaeon]